MGIVAQGRDEIPKGVTSRGEEKKPRPDPEGKRAKKVCFPRWEKLHFSTNGNDLRGRPQAPLIHVHVRTGHQGLSNAKGAEALGKSYRKPPTPGHESPCWLGPRPYSSHTRQLLGVVNSWGRAGAGGTGGTELCQAAALESTVTSTKRKGCPHIPVHPISPEKMEVGKMPCLHLPSPRGDGAGTQRH